MKISPDSSVYSLPRVSTSFSSLSLKYSHSSMTTIATTRTDILEELFVRAEEEHEIRALAQDGTSPGLNAPPVHSVSQSVDTASYMLPGLTTEPKTANNTAIRERGSISISRYGGSIGRQTCTMYCNCPMHLANPSPLSPGESLFCHIGASRTTPTCSADSLASDAVDSSADLEDPYLTTQISQMAPAHPIPRFISRRLSRTRELSPLVPARTQPLVIAVDVEESTYQSPSTAEDPPIMTITSTFGSQRSPPRPWLRGGAAAIVGMSSGWVSRAKNVFRLQ